MTSPIPVGINRRLQLAWLERAATLWLEQPAEAAVRAALRDYLQDRLPSGKRATRGTRSLEQTVTILMRVWVTVPQEASGFRDEGLQLLQSIAAGERVPLQWGAIMAAYPFFAQVADATGRLLSLQGECTLGQIEQRVYEQFGERSTVAYAARRIVRDFVDWGVLADGPARGVYHPARLIDVRERALAVWLVEATLRARGMGSGTLATLLQEHALFPFHLPPLTATDFYPAPRLDTLRQGLDHDLIVLA